jgi:hypothetical protein
MILSEFHQYVNNKYLVPLCTASAYLLDGCNDPVTKSRSKMVTTPLYSGGEEENSWFCLFIGHVVHLMVLSATETIE